MTLEYRQFTWNQHDIACLCKAGWRNPASILIETDAEHDQSPPQTTNWDLLTHRVAHNYDPSLPYSDAEASTVYAVLHHRGDVIKDEAFLKHLSSSSAKALSLLLTPLAPSDDTLTYGRFFARKRRKVVLNMQDSVWRKPLEASESPTWC